MMAIKSRLDEIITERQTTMYALARDTGLNYQTVHALTKGDTKRVDLGTIEKICTELNITIGELFIHTNEEATA